MHEIPVKSQADHRLHELIDRFMFRIVLRFRHNGSFRQMYPGRCRGLGSKAEPRFFVVEHDRIRASSNPRKMTVRRRRRRPGRP